jgi:hypothetical protein
LVIYWYYGVAWSNVVARRKLFETYAKQNGFNPLQPKNWYLQSRHKIKLFKVKIILQFIVTCYFTIQGVASALEYHNDSIITALHDLFPDIGLEKHKFTKQCTSFVLIDTNCLIFYQQYGKVQVHVENSF